MNLPKHGGMCIAIVFLWPLHGMDNPVAINNNRSIAWKILLTHGVSLFDSTMINSLIVSKNHNAILRHTAECRKNYLISKAYNLDIHNGFIWNQWGSMCAQRLPMHCPDLARHEIDQRERYLSIQLCCLSDGLTLDNNVIPTFITWNNFYGCLSHKPLLWFNEFGGVSFYGYGNVKSPGGDHGGDVIEYCTSFSGIKSIAVCVARFKGGDVPLKIFLEFPHILKAFLQSYIVYNEYDYGRTHSRTKVYCSEGVTIPKNYQEHQQYFFNNMYDTFSQVPKCIRKIIRHQYEEQNKKNKGGMGCFGWFG